MSRRIPECHPERKHQAHGLCGTCYTRSLRQRHPSRRKVVDTRYRENNREAIRERHKLWRVKNQEWVRRYFVNRTYGVELDVIENKIRDQKGVCAICRTSPATHIDHSHETGRVRGILCAPCNIGLGYFKENSNFLREAAEYTDFWSII